MALELDRLEEFEELNPKERELAEKLDKFIDELKDKYGNNLISNFDNIIKDSEIYFMQNLQDYDIYTFRNVLFSLSLEYHENDNIKEEILFHLTILFSYLKENLHPVELYGGGVIYSDIFLDFLRDFTGDKDFGFEYPFGIELIKDIFNRIGFINNFVEEEDILTYGVFFYKSLEGKILDFMFNKALFNRTNIILDKLTFLKIEDGEERIVFKTKSVEKFYNFIYEGLEEKFSKVKKRNKFKMPLDKDIVRVRKYLLSLVDEEEMNYLINTAEGNTINFLMTVDFNRLVEDTYKNTSKPLGALSIALGLGIENISFMLGVLKRFKTEDFLNGIISFIKKYELKNNEEGLDIVLSEFVKKYTLEIPLITNNPDTVKLYDVLMEEFKNLLVRENILEENSTFEEFSLGMYALYLFRSFRFKEFVEFYEKHYKSILEELEEEDLEEFLHLIYILTKYKIGALDLDEVVKELDKITEERIKDIEDNEELYRKSAFLNVEDKNILAFIFGNFAEVLKYLLTGKDKNNLTKLVKYYLEDKEKYKNFLRGIYKDKLKDYEEENITFEDLTTFFDTIFSRTGYNIINVYPFDKRGYQLYNPKYKYKVPKFEVDRLEWQ